MWKTLLLIILYLSLGRSSCPSNHIIANLQSANLYFIITDKTPQLTTSTFYHNFLTQFPHYPSISYSIQSIRTNTPTLTQWSISTNNITTSQLNINFVHQPLEWYLVKVGLLASTRQDIVMGALLQNFGNLKQDNASLYLNFTTALMNPNSLIARAFLVGYTQTSGSSTSIAIYSKPLTNLSAQFIVSVADNMQITSVTINYIIFNPKTSEFISYGGTINQQVLTQPKLYNIHKLLSYSQYKFYGIDLLRQNTDIQIGFAIDIDPNFYLKLIPYTQLSSINITFIILGISPYLSCKSCTQSPLVSGTNCLDTCPENSYHVIYNNGGIGCLQCPGQYNMEINVEKNGCACKTGYIVNRGYCVLSSIQNNTFDKVNQQEQSNQTQQPTTQQIIINSLGPTISIKLDTTYPTLNSSIISPYQNNDQLPLLPSPPDNILPLILPSYPTITSKPLSSYNDGQFFSYGGNNAQSNVGVQQEQGLDSLDNSTIEVNVEEPVSMKIPTQLSIQIPAELPDQNQSYSDNNSNISDQTSASQTVTVSNLQKQPQSLPYSSLSSLQTDPSNNPLSNQSQNTPKPNNLTLVSQTTINQNNVYAILQTPTQFIFPSSTQMRSFIKYQFPDPNTQPTSAYCTQRPTQFTIFECLLIYASGVPNKKYSINFSYNYKNQSGFLIAPVDPSTSLLITRSLR